VRDAVQRILGRVELFQLGDCPAALLH
jgi:hypothetical protein